MNPPPRLRGWQTGTLLALANLFWAGNWVVGRALRDVYPPITLNFWRWLLAALILAPFALPVLSRHRALVRRHGWRLVLLAATGCALFQSMVYVGVRNTTSVNAVLLSSSAPLFVMLWSWLLERQAASARQVVGMLVSLGGIALILGRGEPQSLLHVDIQRGDAWILAAMPVWGLYSVLLRRLPVELRGSALLFSMSALAVPMLAGPMLAEGAIGWPAPGLGAFAGLGYVALFASVLAFTCWNRAVAEVGPNAAGSSLPLMPLFGAVLATIFLAEAVQAFHAVGIATILSGIAVATWRRTGTPAAEVPPAPARETRAASAIPSSFR
jgi:drug/metabolite transporter (DMT)-like permease